MSPSAHDSIAVEIDVELSAPSPLWAAPRSEANLAPTGGLRYAATEIT